MKEVLVIGFGAVGAIYSLILKRSGLARVTVVARSNYEVVAKNGVNIKSLRYGELRGWKPDRVCPSVESAADTFYDYVVISTKAIPELCKTSELVAPLISPPYIQQHLPRQSVYVLLQNGLGVEKDLYNAAHIPNGLSIITCALYIGTNMISPNEVSHTWEEKVYAGMYRPDDYTTVENTAKEQGILSDFASIVVAGGSEAFIVPEVQVRKFAKNFWNVAFSSLSSLTLHTLPAIYRSPPGPDQNYEPYRWPLTADLIEKYTIPVVRGVLEEVLAIGRAMGFKDSPDELPSSIIETTMRNARLPAEKPENSFKPSMLLDVEKSRPIEVEVIIGEVVRLAEQFGVNAPNRDSLRSFASDPESNFEKEWKSSRMYVIPSL